MMNRSLQHGCVQDAMLDFEVMNKFMEDDSKRTNCEHERTKTRKTHSRQDIRDAEPTKRFVQGPLTRRWSRPMNLDETYRAPSHFTWRC